MRFLYREFETHYIIELIKIQIYSIFNKSSKLKGVNHVWLYNFSCGSNIGPVCY
jgi:hypothetical protein